MVSCIGKPTDEEIKSEFSNVSFNNLPVMEIPVLDFVQAGLFGTVEYDGINPKDEPMSIRQSPKPLMSLV